MKRTLTIREAADYMGCSIRTVYNRIAAGTIRTERVARPCEHTRVVTDSLPARTVPDVDRVLPVL